MPTCWWSSLDGLICVVYSKRNVEHELPQKRITFYTLLQLLITGLCGITVTGDIFNMYVFIEIMSLSAYALTALEKDRLEGEFHLLDLGLHWGLLFSLGNRISLRHHRFVEHAGCGATSSSFLQQ